MADPAAEDAQAYVQGEMPIEEHRATYRAFDGLLRYGALAVAGLVLFLTLWLCTRASFIGAAVPTVILLVAGGWFLKKPAPSIDTL